MGIDDPSTKEHSLTRDPAMSDIPVFPSARLTHARPTIEAGRTPSCPGKFDSADTAGGTTSQRTLDSEVQRIAQLRPQAHVSYSMRSKPTLVVRIGPEND